jgi:hypothetical protein
VGSQINCGISRISKKLHHLGMKKKRKGEKEREENALEKTS